MAKVVLSYGHGSNTYEDKHSKFVIVDKKVYEEHTHNYQVGTRVKAQLERHGVKVLEVQPPNGKDVALADRTNKANVWGADLYWSIHANAAGKDAKGWAAFYWKGSAKGEKAAKLYAKHVKALGLPLYSTDGIYPSERGTWSDFHELRESKMPAVLTENGFMTNSADFKKIFLNEGNHWDKLAEAHAKAILDYFDIAWKAHVTVKPTKPTATKPKPTTPTASKGVHRVIVDGKQVGAYGDQANVFDQVEKALKGGAKKIEIEKV